MQKHGTKISCQRNFLGIEAFLENSGLFHQLDSFSPKSMAQKLGPNVYQDFCWLPRIFLGETLAGAMTAFF
jgi:hypothetical protein